MLFDSREDLSKGLKIIYESMAAFGLIVHIGRQQSKSKTEVVLFPSPSTTKKMDQ